MQDRKLIDEFKSVSRRLNWIEKKLSTKFKYSDSEQLFENLANFQKSLRDVFGPRIAFEIECKTEAK